MKRFRVLRYIAYTIEIIVFLSYSKLPDSFRLFMGFYQHY